MDEVRVTPRFNKLGSSNNNLVVVEDDILGKKYKHVKMFQSLREKVKAVSNQIQEKEVNPQKVKIRI